VSGQEDGVETCSSSEVLLTGPPEAARNKKEEKVRTKFAILLAIAAVCVTTAWAGWANEEQVTRNRKLNDLRFNTGDRTVIASNDVRHLVWTLDGKVYYKRWYPGTGWTSDYQLSKSGSWPSIALDADGTTVHVVWQAAVGKVNHIYYQRCVPGPSGNGGWVGSPRDLTPSPVGRILLAPVVASFGNRVEVAWFLLHADSIGFCEAVGGTWGNPVYLHDHFASDGATTSASIAVDPQSRYGDVFISCFAYSGDAWARVQVTRRSGGQWQPWEDLPTLGGTLYCDIEIDPGTGCPHILCSDEIYPYPGWGTHVCHTYRDPDLGWQPWELISDPSAHSMSSGTMLFAGGSAFVVWAESISGSDRGIRYAVGNYGNWPTTGWVTSGHTAGFPNVTASSTGNVYVVWGNGNCQTAPSEIWGRLYTPGSGGGQAEMMATPQPGVELFPNPAKAGIVTVQFALPRAEPMRVTLLDVSGRAVRRSEFGVRSSGEGSFTIDVRGLNAGVYVARLVAGDLNVSKSLVVER
jgi:hypothetical protein